MPLNQILLMMEAQRKQGVEAERLVLPDELHFFLRHESCLRPYHAATAFFDRNFGTAQ